MNATKPWRHVWWTDYGVAGNGTQHRLDERVTEQRVGQTRDILKTNTSYWDVIADLEHLLVLDIGGQTHIFIHESLEGGR